MEKISLVAIRRQKNKKLETSALLRARNRILTKKTTESDSSTNQPPFLQTHFKSKQAEQVNEFSFDVVLTPQQSRCIIDQFQKNGARINGKDLSRRPIIFRFNIVPSTPNNTLTSEDVCELLHISRRTLYKYVKKRLIKVIRVGTQLRFLEEDILEFLNERKTVND